MENRINKNFEKKFNQRRKFIKAFFLFNIVMIIGIILTSIYVIVSVSNQPELIGEFVGRIVKAFSESIK